MFNLILEVEPRLKARIGTGETVIVIVIADVTGAEKQV
jgi:hypothetical protein